MLENKSLSDESRMEALENQLKEARMLAEEADKKYDECAKKLATVEGDLDRAEERADTSEHKIVELEEELRVVGNNLKSLEVSEEKANQREEAYKEQIKTLTAKLKQVFMMKIETSQKGKMLASRLLLKTKQHRPETIVFFYLLLPKTFDSFILYRAAVLKEKGHPRALFIFFKVSLYAL